MKATLAILLVFAISCTTVKGSLKTAGVATLGAFSGIVVAATGEKPGCACPTSREVAGGAMFLGGGVVAVVSLIAAVVLAVHIELPSSAPTPGPADIDDPQVIHERVWGMTREAAAAARAHDCEKVKAIDIDVRALDLDFHDTVFVRDAAISACFAK